MNIYIFPSIRSTEPTLGIYNSTIITVAAFLLEQRRHQEIDQKWGRLTEVSLQIRMGKKGKGERRQMKNAMGTFN